MINIQGIHSDKKSSRIRAAITRFWNRNEIWVLLLISLVIVIVIVNTLPELLKHAPGSPRPGAYIFAPCADRPGARSARASAGATGASACR